MTQKDFDFFQSLLDYTLNKISENDTSENKNDSKQLIIDLDLIKLRHQDPDYAIFKSQIEKILNHKFDE